MKFKLMWEPIPQTSWGLSLSNLLGEEKWRKIAKEVYEMYHYECMYCGPVATKLHAHEEWEFYEGKRIQRLKGVVSVCKLCHDCKHWGRSTQVYSKVYQEELLRHMVKVNRCSVKDIQKEINRLTQICYKRVDRRYKVMVGNKELALV